MARIINLHGLDKEKVLSPEEMKNTKGRKGSEDCSMEYHCWGSCVTSFYGETGVCVAEWDWWGQSNGKCYCKVGK